VRELSECVEFIAAATGEKIFLVTYIVGWKICLAFCVPTSMRCGDQKHVAKAPEADALVLMA
jgi:hypothetical protein